MRITRIVIEHCRKCKRKTGHVVFHDASHACVQCEGFYINNRWVQAHSTLREQLQQFKKKQ